MTHVHRLGPVFTLLTVILAIGPVFAADCGAQKGKQIFSDDFKDDSGGFEPDDQAKFGAPGLRLTLAKDETTWAYTTRSFDATDGDFCVVATMPAPVAPDNLAAVGLTVLYGDSDNLVAVYVFSDNTVQIERRSKGKSEFLLSEQKPELRVAAGAEVVVRAVVRDGAISAIVNDVATRRIRLQMPDGQQRFGVYGRLDQDPGKPFPIDFKLLRVTAGEDAR